MINFFKKLRISLEEEYPFKMVLKNEFFTFLKFISVLILLFYVVGFFNRGQNMFYFYLGFMLILFVTFLINYVINLKILSVFGFAKNWCLWKEIVRRLFFLSIYSFNVIFYIDYTLSINFTKVDFVQFITICLIIGSIPIVIKIFTVKNKYLKEALVEAELLNKKISSSNQQKDKRFREELIIKSNIINDVFKIDVNDLLYIQSNQNYISIYYLKDHKIESYLLRVSLVNALKQITSNSILQCHRSYVVNINNIEKVTGNSQRLKLQIKDDIFVPVSRSFVKELKTKLINKI